MIDFVFLCIYNIRLGKDLHILLTTTNFNLMTNP